MPGFNHYTANNKPTDSVKAEFVGFLYRHLGKYGDSKSAIAKCLDFALKETSEALGGFVIAYRDDNAELLGVTIVNKTGMAGYIPENILVYIAVHEKARGRGIGKKVMREALDTTEGDVALHVEPDNPAKFLYEKLGFTNTYLEMRYES